MARLKFDDALKNPLFIKDLEVIKHNFLVNGEDLLMPILGIIKMYGLPRSCINFIKHYICFDGEIYDGEIISPIMLLSEKDNSVGPGMDGISLDLYLSVYPNQHVYLDLTGEIQKQDLIDFINIYWKLIESKLKLVEPSRPGSVRSKLNDKHLEILDLKNHGNSYKEIEQITGYDVESIRTILKRVRRKSGH